MNECLNSTSGTFLILVAFTENMCCNVILLPLDGAERQCVAWELNQSEPKSEVTQKDLHTVQEGLLHRWTDLHVLSAYWWLLLCIFLLEWWAGLTPVFAVQPTDTHRHSGFR